MEPILIYPESVEQLRTVKAVLKALKVQFEPQSKALPPHVLKSIEIGMKQIETGRQFPLKSLRSGTFQKNEF